jgi:hypothetical protein
MQLKQFLPSQLRLSYSRFFFVIFFLVKETNSIPVDLGGDKIYWPEVFCCPQILRFGGHSDSWRRKHGGVSNTSRLKFGEELNTSRLNFGEA